MFDLLALTLAGQAPANQQGDNLNVHWRWLGEGLLEITPHQAYRQAVVLSAGIHGNETAPIELLNQLVNALLAGERPLAVRLLVVLGNPAAIRAGKRYLHSDMNRMFGGRYREFNHSGETARAQQLEQVITAFFDGRSPRVSIMICTRRYVNRGCRVLAFCPSRRGLTVRRCWGCWMPPILTRW